LANIKSNPPGISKLEENNVKNVFIYPPEEEIKIN